MEVKHEYKTSQMYGGVTVEYDYEISDNGYKHLWSMTYTKGERKAVVVFCYGNSNWGRSNAYMTPINPTGRTRSYKDRENAKAKAYEFVTATS